jgi:two-component system NtrC family sensor kinase
VVVLTSLFIMHFTKRFVDAPIRQLVIATRAVSDMQLDTPVSVTSTEELDELATSFEIMRVRLKQALDENSRFTQSLETKVEERTEQLKVVHQKLLQSDRLASLGQLSASVAHEINNPISGVLNLGMLMQRIIKDNGIPEGRLAEFKRYLGQVVAETARVGHIVQDLLAFSRRSKPQRSKIDLNAVIESTVNLIGHKLKLMAVEATLDLDRSIPRVSCDPSQMQQVIINLVMNGAEAAQGRPAGIVHIRTSPSADGSELLLTVKDNGDGIRSEHLSKIFDPFFTTKGEGKGVGLGLAVVYGIIEAHKGEIEVKSKPGEGTTFLVHLPIDEDSVGGEVLKHPTGHAV